MESTKLAAHNMAAEQALLGRLLMYNQEFLNVPVFFNQGCFYVPVHQRIYCEIQRLVSDGKLADAVTLKRIFDEDSELNDVGGARYLAQLVSLSGTCRVVADYCLLIYQEWVRRETAVILQNSLVSIMDGSLNPEDVLASVVSKSNELMDKGKGQEVQTDYEVGIRVLNSLKEQRLPISTGLPSLDFAMDGGLDEKRHYVFAGRPKAGKSVMAATISMNLAAAGHKHLFVCMEMSSDQLMQRMICRRAQIMPSVFRDGSKQNPAIVDRIAQAVTKSTRNVYFEDAPGMSLEQLQRIIPYYVVKHKIKGVILDYWQLIEGAGQRQSKAEHLEKTANWIHVACKRFNIWCVNLAQLNGEGRILYSEGIHRACDQLYAIHKENDEKDDVWLEMMASRYTPGNRHIGDKDRAGLSINPHGPYFEEIA